MKSLTASLEASQKKAHPIQISPLKIRGVRGVMS